MYAQIISFDGPRSDELVAASARAGRERIAPLVASDAALRDRLLGGIRAVAADGTEHVIVLTHDPAALDDLAHLVSASELLPGEDAALLPGPDRVTRCVDAVAFGQLADFLAGAPQ